MPKLIKKFDGKQYRHVTNGDKREVERDADSIRRDGYNARVVHLSRGVYALYVRKGA